MDGVNKKQAKAFKVFPYHALFLCECSRSFSGSTLFADIRVILDLENMIETNFWEANAPFKEYVATFECCIIVLGI